MESSARKQFGIFHSGPLRLLLANLRADFENNIALVDPTKDGIYTYDVAEQKCLYPLGSPTRRS